MPDFIVRTLTQLASQYPESQIPNTKKIGDILGFGSDGFVYEYDANRVIKVSTFGFHKPQVAIERIKYCIQHPSKHIVTIYSCGIVNDVYWYEMEKLKALSNFEIKIFYRIFQNHDEVLEEPTTNWKIKIPKRKQKSQLYHKMYKFLREVGKLPFIHHDLHDDNIMKSCDGKYKLVDVESIISTSQIHSTISYLGYQN